MASRSGRGRRSWPQRLIITGNVIVIGIALIIAAGLGYANTKLADVQRLALSGALTQPDAAPGAPQNFLIVGTDSDLGLSSNDPALQGRGNVTGARSDTIMILHVDPKTRSASLLSLPRDLWVEIAGQGIHQKINSAIGLGGEGTAGPETLIATIQQNFDIPINHYVEIDFAAFEGLIKAVGGIPIYFNTGIRDYDPQINGPHTVINVPGPGCYTLNPTEALAYARSRHLQYQQVPGDTSTWTSDGGNDFGRIARQQDFVRRVLKRAIAKGVRDPLVMNELVNTGIKSVRIDTGLSAGDVLSLGRRFRSFDPNALKTIQLPSYATYIGDASVVLPKLPEAESVLARFRNVAANAADPVRSVEVEVRNGTGRYNEATKVTDALDKVGFSTGTPSDELGVTGAASIIRYHAGQEAQARLLARHLDSEVTFQLLDDSSSTDGSYGSNGSTGAALTGNTPLQLVTGTSYAGVLATPKAASAVPGPTSTTTTSTTTSTPPDGASSTTGTASTSTTSTVPGYVPGPAPAGKSCG